MSGRALRRLPVLALARYIGIGTTSTALAMKPGQPNGTKTGQLGSHGASIGGAEVVIWLDAMERVVQEQISESAKLA